MDLMLKMPIASPPTRIRYTDKIMVMGSCFTEHIGGRLKQLKFHVLQNPNGILFDSLSVSRALISYIDNKRFGREDLIYFNELWQSWQHHSIFSGMQEQDVLDVINSSQEKAHEYLKQCQWLIVTLGSSFSYRLAKTGAGVANCHRAPAQWFDKHLLSIDETTSALDAFIQRLRGFNDELNIVFTISPVRHIRDGVIENNRSKARLVEAVHAILPHWSKAYYFPAYELVIDVLRDYRFYDIDLVHPNYAATEFVFESFIENYLDPGELPLLSQVRDFVTARRHKPQQPETRAHKLFISTYLKKVRDFQEKHPHIDCTEELRYFSASASGAGTVA